MSWSWLAFWRPRKKLTHRNVVMYKRQGCHLCEQAWQQLEEARQRYRFQLAQVDVDGDPQLVREYGECVPVVVIDGKVRFRGVLNRVLLERLLSR
ncbi:MAG TPA: glutaredoxin family protein [Gemmataceae bacterium]|nr:glutaredoxin family protein [Gemmataceae bacterium]